MIELLREYVFPNIWGALITAVGWIAVTIRDKRKNAAESDNLMVDAAKKIIDMSGDMAARLESQNEKQQAINDKLRDSLMEITMKYNDCQTQLIALDGLKQHLDSMLQEKNKELEESKQTICEWRKILNYDTENKSSDNVVTMSS